MLPLAELLPRQVVKCFNNLSSPQQLEGHAECVEKPAHQQSVFELFLSDAMEPEIFPYSLGLNELRVVSETVWIARPDIARFACILRDFIGCAMLYCRIDVQVVCGTQRLIASNFSGRRSKAGCFLEQKISSLQKFLQNFPVSGVVELAALPLLSTLDIVPSTAMRVIRKTPFTRWLRARSIPRRSAHTGPARISR